MLGLQATPPGQFFSISSASSQRPDGSAGWLRPWCNSSWRRWPGCQSFPAAAIRWNLCDLAKNGRKSGCALKKRRLPKDLKPVYFISWSECCTFVPKTLMFGKKTLVTPHERKINQFATPTPEGKPLLYNNFFAGIAAASVASAALQLIQPHQVGPSSGPHRLLRPTTAPGRPSALARSVRPLRGTA